MCRYRPLELDVDDAGVAELVVAAGLGHGAEGRAAEVEVVLGHRVVVHVGDDHRLHLAGAGLVLGAPNLRDPRERPGKRQCTVNDAVTEDRVGRAHAPRGPEDRLLSGGPDGTVRQRPTLTVAPPATLDFFFIIKVRYYSLNISS